MFRPSRDGKVEDIYCLNKKEKAEEAFSALSQFWDKDLENFKKTTTAESQLIVGEIF